MKIYNFEVTVDEVQSKNINRMNSEAIKIDKTLSKSSYEKTTFIMNTKTDYHQPKFVKLSTHLLSDELN